MFRVLLIGWILNLVVAALHWKVFLYNFKENFYGKTDYNKIVLVSVVVVPYTITLIAISKVVADLIVFLKRKGVAFFKKI